MDRRTYLRCIAVGSIATAGGCIETELEEAEREPPPLEERTSPEEVDLPVRQRLQVAETAIERAEGATIDDVDGLGTFLEEESVQVETIEETTRADEPIVELEYVGEELYGQGFMHALGLVAGGYATLVSGGNDSEKVEASLLDREGRKFGEFEVERMWAEEYEEGSLTAREYANEVVVTAEATTQ